MIRVFFAILAINMALVLTSHAQELSGPRYDEAKEAEIAVKAKKRLYPGGRDEEELKVQSQLTTPVRKLAPQAEVKEESSEE
ncbi:hypothetical protein AZI86_17180 [Bdellovibrio bacteriovorus]|uniref:Uncharacterized protein n=1 Tax=Bdellovibrio bacteriovorus TaxID=959 RepID=A0A150WEV3_BDEBC|nr:hypothetical protein [Bdellovibrio bacteriovorus]KYG61445.1 hypothetical protein AZI86_17180 [Bdellovibrio bacteriovorus]